MEWFLWQSWGVIHGLLPRHSHGRCNPQTHSGSQTACTLHLWRACHALPLLPSSAGCQCGRWQCTHHALNAVPDAVPHIKVLPAVLEVMGTSHTQTCRQRSASAAVANKLHQRQPPGCTRGGGHAHPYDRPDAALIPMTCLVCPAGCPGGGCTDHRCPRPPGGHVRGDAPVPGHVGPSAGQAEGRNLRGPQGACNRDVCDCCEP